MAQEPSKKLNEKELEAPASFTSPDVLYQDLIRTIHQYHPSDDISMVEKAYRVANECHKDQKRKSGEPYIIHPLCVAIILADLEMDKETIAAGLLHDVVEDTGMTLDELSKEFGTEVSFLVDGVTKLTQLSWDKDKVEIQAENLRKMFLAMAKDIRVIIIKLADRLHNMRTGQFWKPEKQKEKARETLEIYAPIADRLGISKIKIELDDLSLRFLKPDVYYDLVEKVNLRKDSRDEFVQEIVTEVQNHMKEAGIEATVYGRVKHYFSIYKKMINQNKTLEQIYDLFAVRIMVDSVKDCYAALGVIHEMYKPIPGRFKDYIAMPKQNMYQSLHTTLIGNNGQPFEIQIRTYEMHRTAEYGIAAHWKYKESGGSHSENNQSEQEKMAWLRRILEWQHDMDDNKDFLTAIKSDLDLFSDRIYCFTPNGDVKNLPAGSTPIDFAYAVHTAVGNKMVGARVNGNIVKMDYEIQNGDRIDIITSQNSRGPSRDWLSIVKSSQAKNKINQWFRNEFKEDNIIKGKELLHTYCKNKGIDLSPLLRNEYTEACMHKYGFRDWESVCAAIGHGGLKEGQVVNKLQDEYNKKNKRAAYNAHIHEMLEGVKTQRTEGSGPSQQSSSKKKSGIIVEGLDDLAVRFSKCCSPVPGDEIVGFVTRGRGVSIHRTDCVNMIHLPESEKNRLIDAEWSPEADQSDEVYPVEIVIYCFNRSGVLLDVSRVFTENKIDVKSMNVRVTKQDKATLTVGFETSSLEQLDRLIVKLKNIESVTSIERSTNG